jgi:Mlc titration factor MtfA (ptsG expression regulator)
LTRSATRRAQACWLCRWLRRAVPIPPALWQRVIGRYPFLARLPDEEQARLKRIAEHFLARKTFSGAHGLTVTDFMAVTIAAQACLPLLHLGPAGRPEAALRWYGDFVGIVLHPADALARRTAIDAAGVVHHYTETLAGEAMQRGPVMLSWPAVERARTATNDDPDDAATGYAVVIHEFIHKMDMQGHGAAGAPPLPRGFMGAPNARAAARHWRATWAPAYQQFREQVIRAERFGAPRPWLDAYAATSPAEFFAVACEAHFVHPQRFAAEFPPLASALRAFFRQG